MYCNIHGFLSFIGCHIHPHILFYQVTPTTWSWPVSWSDVLTGSVGVTSTLNRAVPGAETLSWTLPDCKLLQDELWLRLPHRSFLKQSVGFSVKVLTQDITRHGLKAIDVQGHSARSQPMKSRKASDRDFFGSWDAITGLSDGKTHEVLPIPR
jgi:hypothetical protein